MLYEANTPTEYLEALDDDWRKEKVLELRKLIFEKAPDIEEGINYKMLCYRGDNGIVFHLNAQKNYVSLYVGDASKVDPDGSLLEGINKGKGCVRLSKSIDIAQTRLDQFIERTIDMWKKGEDIYC